MEKSDFEKVERNQKNTEIYKDKNVTQNWREGGKNECINEVIKQLIWGANNHTQ